MDAKKVKYIKLSDSIIIHYGGKTETFSSSHKKYPDLLKAIEEDNMSDFLDILEKESRKKIKEMLKL